MSAPYAGQWVDALPSNGDSIVTIGVGVNDATAVPRACSAADVVAVRSSGDGYSRLLLSVLVHAMTIRNANTANFLRTRVNVGIGYLRMEAGKAGARMLAVGAIARNSQIMRFVLAIFGQQLCQCDQYDSAYNCCG